ncbi:hypothetical protein BH10BDE1_BH10BDE1_23720 [soil metagenome]
MGTSISQPSPKGTGEAGKSWKRIKDAVSSGAGPAEITKLTLQAYSAQFKNQFIDILSDVAVQIVQERCSAQLKSKVPIGQFLIETRRELASQNANSFLGEIALSSANEVLRTKESIGFAAVYLGKVVEYVISRDLQQHLGSLGNPNLFTTQYLINSVRQDLQTRISKTETVKGAIQSIGLGEE